MDELSKDCLERIKEISGGEINYLKLFQLLLNLRSLYDKREEILDVYSKARSGLPKEGELSVAFEDALFRERKEQMEDVYTSIMVHIHHYFDKDFKGY